MSERNSPIGKYYKREYPLLHNAKQIIFVRGPHHPPFEHEDGVYFEVCEIEISDRKAAFYPQSMVSHIEEPYLGSGPWIETTKKEFMLAYVAAMNFIQTKLPTEEME